MRRTHHRSTLARALAGLLALTFAHPLWAAPGDITQVPAPMMGSDPPKAKDISDGDASVSTQTGALQYSFPIAVPPGRLGMAPQLALSYSSQAPVYGGVASGWSLSIPDIRLDTSESLLQQKYWAGLDANPWARERYVSSLSGSRPLVPVNEPHDNSVYQTFRAQNDSGWIRYERMNPGEPYKWRAKTPDGITHYFGDQLLGAWSSNVVPLTRTVDSFGNTIEYEWSHYQISQIRYTSNQAAGLGAFAVMEFEYAPIEQCGRLPIGALEDRRLDWIDGEKRLTKIRAVAFNPSNGAVEHTREYTLGYDSAAMSCTANHSPIRLLTSIQESAWGPVAPLVALPPVTFSYNRLERTFDRIDTGLSTPWIDPITSDAASVSTGTRSPSAWPNIDAMMLDFDGDGLVDRITRGEDPNECTFLWEKNEGRNPNNGLINFAAPVEQSMPRLPWRNGQREPGELCTLNYQFTKRGNIQDPPGSCNDNNGTYLAYRWMDITGDGLVDLVAAIHHDTHYDPNIDLDPAFFPQLHVAGWPTCPAPDAGACPVPSSACMQNALECPELQPCRLSEPAVAACMSESPHVTCDRLMRGMDQYGPDDPDQNQVGPDWPGGDPPSGNCGLKKEHERCERFAWLVYENTGGELEGQGEVKYQPAPLESDGGDSSIGGGGGAYSSTAHALQDMDGDGFIDLVVRGKYSEIITTTPPIWWFVWRGDGTGGFLSHETGDPYVWYVPENAHINGSCPSEAGTLCSTPPPGTANTTVPGYASLTELNGDGAVDFVWSLSDGSAIQAQGFWGDGLNFANYGPGTPQGELLGSGVDMLSRSWVHGDSFVPSGPWTNWLITGWRQSHNQSIDVDNDGRADLVSSELTGYDTAPWPTKLRYNDGGSFLAPRDLNQMSNLQAGLMQRTEATGSLGDDHWAVKWDLIDLDGDGLPEQWKFPFQLGQTTSERRDVDTQPMRLLKHVDNGRGGSVEVVYASTSDTTAVTQDSGSRKSLPRTQWVVKSLSVHDLWDADVSTTTYNYRLPVWSADERGRWGFRGFEEVITFAPSMMATLDDYAYDVDWSGRLVGTKTYSADDYANPKTISESTWEPRSLFGGLITTYHMTHARKWTCNNGQSELWCKIYNSGYTHTSTTLAPLPATGDAQLYFAKDVWRSVADVTVTGDRRRTETKVLFSDTDDYRLQTTLVEEFERQLISGAPVDVQVGKEIHSFDPTYRVEESEDVYFTLVVDPDDHHHAVTQWTYDMATGLKLTERSPRNPTGPVETYTYDPGTKRFVTMTVNEKGHTVERKYDSGTGTELTESGPNFASCGTNCTNWEQTWTDIDGLGRTTAAWVNRADTGNSVWQKTQVGRFKYTDSVIGGARTKVESDALIDYGGTRWTHEVTELDGQGRPDIVTVTTGGAANAVTSYDYDHRGLVVGVTLPDPSQNNASTVTYTYGYDSLGRPISMLRPAIGGANPSGIDMGYDGLVHSRAEKAGSLGGSEAKTDLIHDNFGRLVEVREWTSGSTYSQTLYQYDVNDNVKRIQNPDGVITELFHDFESRRTSIVRAGKTWEYTYFPTGELKSERAPSTPLEAINYTNTYTYDEIGRESTRSVGARDLASSDQSLFGVGLIVFSYDSCVNGIGRLCTSRHPSEVLTSSYQYDAEGNTTRETRTFNFGGVTGTRVSSMTHGPGGRVVSQTFADNSNSGNATVAFFEFDDRALPATVKWKAGTQTKTVATQTRNTAGLVTNRSTSFQTTGWNETSSNWTYDQLTRVVDQQIVSSASGQLARQHVDYFGQDDPSVLRHWMGTSYYELTFGYDKRHQLNVVDEAVNRFEANYDFTASGKIWRAYVGGTAGPGNDVLTRDVTYSYLTDGSTDPEAPVALKDFTTGAHLRDYTYDSVGNMVTRSDGNTADAFAYDGEDQLRRASVTQNGETSKEEYYYDHRGNRAAVVTRKPGGLAGVRVFLGDTEIVLKPTGALSKTYAHLSLGTPVARITNRTGVELQYHGLANNTLLSVKPDGATQSGFVYGPYGELLESTGMTVPDQHRRFNDKFRDDLTQLSYYGVRYYDGVLLGWTQADPMLRFQPDLAWDDPRQALLYSFSMRNPLAYLDPDGRWSVRGAVSGAVSLGKSAVTSTINHVPAVEAYRQVNRVIDVASGNKSAGQALRETAVESLEKASAIAGGSGMRAVYAGMAVGGATAAVQGGNAQDILTGAAIGGGTALAADLAGQAMGKMLRPCGCFVAGTVVHTDRGAVPIEQLQVGDMVWAQDVNTGAVELSRVLAVFVRDGRERIDLTIAGMDGGLETIGTTDDHPFWTQRGWVEVKSLRLGDQVLLGGRGAGVVSSIVPTAEHEVVYNLEVEGFHSYFVGHLGALVHNCATTRGTYTGKVHNISPSHNSRKAAQDAATHAHGGKPRPTPPKSDVKKRRAWEQQQKYRKPESHPDSAHPDSHFHDADKGNKAERHRINRHHVWGGS